MNLWLAALRNSPGIVTDEPPSLRDLFPQAVNLLSTNLDLLGNITSIMESYFLLDGTHILRVRKGVIASVGYIFH